MPRDRPTAAELGAAAAGADAALGRYERYERAQERKRIVVDDRPRPRDLEILAASYQRRGLRPIVDEQLGLVGVDCVRCGAGDDLYRPVRVVPRARYRADGKPVDPLLTVICEACGYHDERPL